MIDLQDRSCPQTIVNAQTYISLKIGKLRAPYFMTLQQIPMKVHIGIKFDIANRPFPSSLVPLFQSKSKCETFLMKMTLICMKMKLHAELIFI